MLIINTCKQQLIDSIGIDLFVEETGFDFWQASRNLLHIFFNLGCLHPVARVRSGDGVFIPCKQLLYCYMLRSYDHLQAENI
jgi:hypothetical protein